MALGSCYSCIKYLMFAFNFLFWLLGCAILGVGIWFRVDPNMVKYVNHADEINVFYTLSYVFMAIGIIIMIIGFLGCCGAIRESQCMLGTFFILLFIIFAVLLGFGIWVAVEKDTQKDLLAQMLQKGVDTYDSSADSQRYMDLIQREFKCCGARKGGQDYNHTAVPDSCRFYENTSKPCADAFYIWAAERLTVIAGVAIAVAIVLILGMIFSMALCCALRDTVVH